MQNLIMVNSCAQDGSVQERIKNTINDGVALAALLPCGEFTTNYERCDQPIPRREGRLFWNADVHRLSIEAGTLARRSRVSIAATATAAGFSESKQRARS